MSLRIAMIGQKTNAMGVGGIETHVNRLAEEMERRGHLVTIFARKGYPQAPIQPPSSVKVRPCLHTKHLEAITHSAWCTLEAAVRDYDVVHFHGVGPAIVAPVARMRRRHGVCVTVHDQDYNKDKWSPTAKRVLRLGEAMACRYADEVVVVADYLKDHLSSSYGRTAHVIPHGAEELESVAPGPLLQSFGLEPGKYVIFVGRLVPEKGVDVLIRAHRQSTSRHRLAIIGGSSHSDEYVQHLHDLADGDPRIVFTGYQADEALAELRSNAASYIMPSFQEGLPLALLEALWLGLSVIATDIPAVKGIGADALNSDLQLVPAHDVDALQRAIEGVPYPAPANVGGRFPWPTWEMVGERTELVYQAAMRRRPHLTNAPSLS